MLVQPLEMPAEELTLVLDQAHRVNDRNGPIRILVVGHGRHALLDPNLRKIRRNENT